VYNKLLVIPPLMKGYQESQEALLEPVISLSFILSFSFLALPPCTQAYQQK